ncbi:hypothetical protein ACFSJ3_18155 [Corallincola platygyrae]|uniref:Uncharacterized protein n=1 Tax=Corallincola platygyrae TaxID=1193278 RepID=A0ABW4XSV7_9GAMM
MNKVLLLTLPLLLTACARIEYVSNDADTEARVKESLGWLYTADPAKEASTAIADGDYRFRGVYGYSVSAPGIPNACVHYTDINPINGTSDTRASYEEAKLNAIAIQYATYYNFYIRRYLAEHQGWDCSTK